MCDKMEEGEAFMKLWFTPPLTDFSPYIQDEKTFLDESYVFRSFRSEFETDKCFTKNCLKAVKVAQDKNDYSSSTRFEDFIPGYSALSYLPRKSVFNREEMNECYELVLLLSNFKSLSLEQQEKLNYYKARMSEEQKEYLSLAKSQWMRENYTRHKEISPLVEKLINTLWQAKLDTVRTYPKFYSQLSLISLCPSPDDDIRFIYCGQLKQIGKMPKLYLPNLRFIKVNINNCVEAVNESRLQEKPKMVEELRKAHGYDPQVSKDRLAETLALQNNANIVMSASAFLALVDNHMPDFLATWDLPVTVKEYKTDSGISQKIVYIDKKFPARSLNQNERKNIYCKMACDLRLRSMSGVNRSSKGGEDINAYEDQNEASSHFYNIKDNEFTSSEEMDSAYPQMNIQPSINHSDSDSDSKSLIIDENEDSSINDYLSNQMSSSSIKKEIKQERKENNESISYNLWRLHKATSSYLSKNTSRDMAVLIRCKEGHVATVKKGDKSGEQKKELYKVMSKMEYQPEYGAEQVSLTELTKQWASLLIRPATHLARVRVNPLDGEIIMYDRLNVSNLATEGQRLYGVHLTKCLIPFHSVVEKLSNLPAGQYYVSHRPVNSAFAPLYRATTGTYDLSLMTSFNINSSEVAPERASWNPIDVNIIHPTFKHFHRVPAMFTPCRFQRTGESKYQLRSGKGAKISSKKNNQNKAKLKNTKKKGKNKRNKGKRKKVNTKMKEVV